MVETAEQQMTLAEFLEWDDGTDTHYELVAGKMVDGTAQCQTFGRCAKPWRSASSTTQRTLLRRDERGRDAAGS
jgi:hypothetical protein